MYNLKKLASLIFILLLSLGLQAQETKVSLSLEDCILKAMKSNLNLAVEVLNPELADASVSLAKEQFLPSLRHTVHLTSMAGGNAVDCQEQSLPEHNHRRWSRLPSGIIIPNRDRLRRLLPQQRHPNHII